MSQLFAPVPLDGELDETRPPRERRWQPLLEAALRDLPAGERRFWGIPFQLAPEGDGPAWVLVDRPRTLALDGGASGVSHVVFVHTCGLPATATANVLPDPIVHAGERVADYVLVYTDGSEHRQPIRWRFEINGGPATFGLRAFAARPNQMDQPLDFRGPFDKALWGRAQTSVDASQGRYWVYALANPHPDRVVTALRLEPASQNTGGAVVAVAAITRFHGQDHPLRHRRLETFRVMLPEPRDRTLPDVEIDLGIVARKYAVPAFDPDGWLGGDGVVRAMPSEVSGEPLREIYLDIAASADATLRVGDRSVALRPAYERGAASSDDRAIRLEVVGAQRTWVHVTLQDGASTTGKGSPGRVHFRDPHGRYLPPYGFRHEVNDNWFEDYGADVKLHGTEYAYVDGRFQMELPVGEVYVELFKGFEHRPLRQKLTIASGQRELHLTTERPLDWRHRGWITADTHVHFISPQTAWLQGQAEGLNVINLLASQWGDLYTNVGDISGALSGVSRDETLVWVGTENRQHLLGHMSLLGVKGEPVYPMTTSGPSESYIGDPTWTTLAEWSDEARRKDGVVVIPHFPSPYCEVAADIVLGKIDGVELNMSEWNMQLHEWYRYLNCGYRVAAVGGTDKMGAYMPVGAIRTYARLEETQLASPLTYEAWAGAVRAGRTFTTTGPLVDVTVEGRHPGDEIALPAGGGTLHVEAVAESVVKFDALEVVVNGRVVASETGVVAGPDGTYRCRLAAPVAVSGSAWIAARVASDMDRWIGSPRRVAAHTSPVYVVAGAQELFSPSDATYMLTLLEGGLTWLDTLSIPADPERHARNRKVFEDARGQLHQRLHAHGEGHGHDRGHAHH
ncbi:MAG TPA: CehA/McbA family metallohydrolase [Chloroflexota bacterium]|nr:CehA/McbA family metallohydrolase [Chloroflexota bacterium]